MQEFMLRLPCGASRAIPAAEVESVMAAMAAEIEQTALVAHFHAETVRLRDEKANADLERQHLLQRQERLVRQEETVQKIVRLVMNNRRIVANQTTWVGVRRELLKLLRDLNVKTSCGHVFSNAANLDLVRAEEYLKSVGIGAHLKQDARSRTK